MRSLRGRLLVSTLGTLALAALLFAALTYRNVQHETERLFDYQLGQMALSLRDMGEVPAAAFEDNPMDFVVQIWSADGRTIYASRPHADLPSRAILGLAEVRAGGQSWRTYSVAARGRVIQVAQPMEVRQRFAVRAALNAAVPIALLALPLAALIWWQVAQALKPLRRLSREVAAREAQLLQPLPETGLPAEAQPLVQAFNALLARLGAAFDAQRGFVADAAHELRSPLTALSLQVQMLRRAAEPADRDAAVAALGEGVERARRLVEQLLALAREEPGAPQRPFERVDLAEAVRQAMAGEAALAASLGSTLSLEGEETLVVQGDGPALATLARNLVDNALRYAGERATVQVRLAREGNHAVLWVDDSGPGLPEADRARVFDRFWRRDSAAAPQATGTGLGMAIVKRIADRHGATLHLGEAPLGGLRVALRLPLAP